MWSSEEECPQHSFFTQHIGVKQTNKYLPSTFVEVPHSSAKQSGVPTNLTDLLVNEIKPRKLNAEDRSMELLIN